MNKCVGTQSIWSLVNKSIVDLPKVSVVIVSYHTGPALRDCLSTLVNDGQIFEIIIVNNGNKPRDVGYLNRLQDTHPERILLISGHGNVGFAAGSNLGARAAKGDRILFLNPDALLRRGSVAALEEAAGGRAEPWIVGGRIFGPDGVEQRGGRRRMLRFTSAIMTYMGLSPFERLHPIFQGINRTRETCPSGPVPMPVVSGALMYMSRQGFEILNGFDENYFLHVEDIDICRRAQEIEGGSVYYTPLAGAMHHGGTSDASSLRVEWEKACGLGRYFRKFSTSIFEKLFAYLLVPVFACLLITRSYGRTAITSARRKMDIKRAASVEVRG